VSHFLIHLHTHIYINIYIHVHVHGHYVKYGLPIDPIYIHCRMVTDEHFLKQVIPCLDISHLKVS